MNMLQNSFKALSTHFVAPFFMLSPQCITWNKDSLFAQKWQKKIQNFLNQEFISIGQDE